VRIEYLPVCTSYGSGGKTVKKALATFAAIAWLAAASTMAAEIKLGAPIAIKDATTIRDLLATPDKYLGKNVRLEGEIVEVCQMMGCWIKLHDASSKEIIQVKVEDGVIVFPKDGAGKQASVQGKVEKLVLSKEEYVESLKHEAAEGGKKIDTSKITEGKTIYRIRGEGAVIK
jgi:hypothetical protein